MIQTFDQLLKSAGLPGTGDDAVENLRKALSTTTSGAGGLAQGPLILENLDPVMTEVLLTNSHFKLFNHVPKVPSMNPYYEWNRHSGYGQPRGSLGFAEGGGPTGSTSSFSRTGTYVKFLGKKGGYTHQLSVSGSMGGTFEDPVARENKDRTLELLDSLERNFMFGNKLVKDKDAVEVNFDGLLKQVTAGAAANVIDMKGAAFGFDQLDADARNLVTVGKVPTVNGFTSFMSPHVIDGLGKQFTARNMVRFNKDQGSAPTYSLGQRLEKYDSQFGTINLDHSLLLEEVPDSAVPAVAGNALTATAPTMVAADDATSVSTLPAATYYYSVSCLDADGESLATVSAGSVGPTAGQKVTVTVTKTTGATGYRLYRGFAADGSDGKLIKTIPAFAAATEAHVDQNGWRGVTAAGAIENGVVVTMNQDPKDIAWAQLAPLSKMPLPQVNTTYPFLLLLYGVLVAKAPERIRIYKNCGEYVAP